MRAHLLILLAACTPTSTSSPAVPWLRNFNVTQASDTLAPGVVERMQTLQDCDEPCANFGGIELEADISPRDGVETVLAGFSQGVLVLDERGRVLAKRGRFEPVGSADELLSMAVLDGPLLAVAIRSGGRRESEVRLELYRVSDSSIDVAFSGAIERHDGDGDAIGSLTAVPGGVLYAAPGARVPVMVSLDPTPASRSRPRTHPPAPSR